MRRIVVVKVAVVLFVLGLGSHYVNHANWGTDWHSFAPYGFGGHRRWRRLISSSRISASTRSRRRRRRRRIRSAICRSGLLLSLAICTLLVYRGGGGADGHGAVAEVNIEAPIARAFLDRNLSWACEHHHAGRAGRADQVMLVMLLGQTRVLYAMANDGLLPKKFFAEVHPRFRTPWKNTILVGTAGGDCRRADADR